MKNKHTLVKDIKIYKDKKLISSHIKITKYT